MTFSDVTPPLARGLALAGLVLVAGCGQGGGSSTASASPSAKASSSSTSSRSAEAPAASATADGKCGGGKFKTKVVTASRGVTMTVPASWTVTPQKPGSVYRLYPPNRSSGDGYLVVQPSSLSLTEVIDKAQAGTRDAAKVESEETLSRAGLEARLTTFRYSEKLQSAFSVNLAAVGGGVRVIAGMSQDKSASDQAVAESCLSSVQRR